MTTHEQDPKRVTRGEILDGDTKLRARVEAALVRMDADATEAGRKAVACISGHSKDEIMDEFAQLRERERAFGKATAAFAHARLRARQFALERAAMILRAALEETA